MPSSLATECTFEVSVMFLALICRISSLGAFIHALLLHAYTLWAIKNKTLLFFR